MASNLLCTLASMTVRVDEFRKIMVHTRDGGAMTQVWSRRKQVAVRVFTWCGSTKCKFVDRDLNKAVNLRR